jgi:hypothetical protein
MGYNFFENFFVLCHGAKVAKKNLSAKAAQVPYQVLQTSKIHVRQAIKVLPSQA